MATDNTYDSNDVYLLSTTHKYTDPDLGLQTAITKFEYNDPNNPGLATRIIPPRGNTNPNSPDYSYATSFAYNASGSQAGMLLSTTDPLGNVMTYTYDAVGNRTFVTDANGQVTKYLYDVRDSLTEVDQSPFAWTSPNSPPSTVYSTTYTYDNLGNLQRVTRAKGDATYERATDYAYDGLNRLRQETQYPNWPTASPTLVTTYTYDANNNPLTMVDPLSKTTTFGYDALNRLTSITYSDGQTPNVSYSYDANNNRTAMQDGTGTTSYSLDERDRLTAVTSPGPKTIGYRYDLDGNRTKIIYPDNTAVTYTFNKGSQLASLADWANRSTSYQFNPDGSLKLATNVNNTTASYSYDNAARLTQVLNHSGASTISQHAYTLDNVGNRTQVSETLAQVGGGSATNNITYSYDKLYRLTGDGTRTYGYDPVGNRLSLTQGSTTNYTYDKADRILTAGATSFTVDANGNETARGSDSFHYDQANRLTLSVVGGITTTYAYDGDGKRVSQRTGITTTRYLYDVTSSLPNVLADGTHTYVYGVGLAYAVDSLGSLQVYHTDGLGSVRAISDRSGNRIQTYQTDAFGVPTQTQGSSRISTLAMPLGVLYRMSCRRPSNRPRRVASSLVRNFSRATCHSAVEAMAVGSLRCPRLILVRRFLDEALQPTERLVPLARDLVQRALRLGQPLWIELPAVLASPSDVADKTDAGEDVQVFGDRLAGLVRADGEAGDRKRTGGAEPVEQGEPRRVAERREDRRGRVQIARLVFRQRHSGKDFGPASPSPRRSSGRPGRGARAGSGRSRTRSR